FVAAGGVVALAAGDGVVAGAAVDGQPDHIGRQAARVNRVIAIAALDREQIAGLGIGKCHLLREPGHGDGGAHVGDADLVVAARAVYGHRVGRAVAGALSIAEMARHLRHAGAGEVADGDVVRPAPRGELNLLDAVEVHDDAADVAGEPHALTIGLDVDLLGDIGAVE